MKKIIALAGILFFIAGATFFLAKQPEASPGGELPEAPQNAEPFMNQPDVPIYASYVPSVQVSLDEQAAQSIPEQVVDRLDLSTMYPPATTVNLLAQDIPNGSLLGLYLTVASAVDRDGSDVLDKQRPHEQANVYYRSFQRILGSAHFSPPILEDAFGKSPVTLRGTLKIQVPTKVIKITWDPAKEGVAQTQEGIEFSLDQVRDGAVKISSRGAKYPDLCLALASDNSGSVLEFAGLPESPDAAGESTTNQIHWLFSGKIDKIDLYQVLEVWEQEVPIELESIAYRPDGTPQTPLKPRYLASGLDELTTKLDKNAVEQEISIEVMPITANSETVDFKVKLPNRTNNDGVRYITKELKLMAGGESLKVAGTRVLSTLGAPGGALTEQMFSVFGGAMQRNAEYAAMEPLRIEKVEGTLRIEYPLQYTMEELSLTQPMSAMFRANFQENVVEIYRLSSAAEGNTSVRNMKVPAIVCEAFDESGQRLAPMPEHFPKVHDYDRILVQPFAGKVAKVRVYCPVEVAQFDFPVQASKG